MGAKTLAGCDMPVENQIAINERVKSVASDLLHEEWLTTLCASFGNSRKTG